jgi:hypothetical protein
MRTTVPRCLCHRVALHSRSGLQGLADRTDKPEHIERINGYIDTIDKVISGIRTSIFQLQARQQYPVGIQSRLLELLDEHGPAGPVDRAAGS